MKTTLDLPDELMRRIKVRAAREDRKLKDLVADLLRRGLAAESSGDTASVRVRLPLIETAHAASPEEEMTPERVAAMLLADEAHTAAGQA